LLEAGYVRLAWIIGYVGDQQIREFLKIAVFSEVIILVAPKNRSLGPSGIIEIFGVPPPSARQNE